MDSILNFGQSTTNAMMQMMNINWQSFAVIAVLITVAAILIPKIAGLITGLLSDFGLPTDILGAVFGKNGTRANYDNYSSYSEYIKRMEGKGRSNLKEDVFF